ncbi:hypothetical protein SDC9_99797 [bioreactor metagenome]|uniref:Uncharacterized protein n=1 Tax=bioreactor metagenome TaxID=1076179 RepID=A0A645AQA0_9ZZZZ
MKLIFVRDKFRAAQLCETGADLGVEPFGRVQPGAHGGAADGKAAKL